MNDLTSIKYLLLFLAGTFSLSGQKTTITGRILDTDTNQPLAYATVSLLAAADSSLIAGGITFEDGRFNLDAGLGDYLVKAGFVGYHPQFLGPFSVDGSQNNIDIGTVSLNTDAEVLDEIVVSTERSQTEMALDKRVFNVGKDLASSGNSAVDILDNVPSVAVDVEGNVTLRGSSGVRILIDGKPSGLVGVGGTDGLRSLPADLIERVEVITNPSARYEAEGTAGIINIVLKKDRRSGLNGSINLNTGIPDNHGLGFNVNYRRNNFNFFANAGARLRTSPGTGYVIQEFFRNDSLFVYEQDRTSDRTSWSLSTRTGAEYFFNENTTLTGAFQYRYGESDNFTELEYRDYVGSRTNLERISIRKDNELETDPTFEYALTFRKQFDDRDHELVADLRWQDNTEQETSDLVEAFFSPDFENLPNLNDLIQRSDNKESERQLISQLDYRKPLGDEGMFEIGYRGSFRRINNDYLVEEITNGEWLSLEGLSNNFNYEEDVLAAYTTFGNSFGNFSFQTGLRAEYSLIITELEQTQKLNERDYFNLFPSVFLNYEFPGENQVQVSYSRRIRRPSFRSLNPFFSFSDNRNFRSGNPNLDPEFTDSYEVSHLKFWDKGSLTSAVYYRKTSGVTENIREVFDDGTSVSFPVNLSTEKAIGIEFTFSYRPWEWMRLNGNANFFRAETMGNFNGQEFEAEATTLFSRLTSQLDFDDKTNFQLRGNYRAPRATPQGKTKSLYSIDLALARDIINEHATLTLNVQDLLNSRKRRYITEGPNFYTEGEFQWRARTVTLSFNYRLNANDRQRNRGNRRDQNDGGDFGDEEFGK